jgi:hypothetical protein
MEAQEITIRIPAGASAEDTQALFDQVCRMVSEYVPTPEWPNVTVGMTRYAGDPPGPEMFLTRR